MTGFICMNGVTPFPGMADTIAARNAVRAAGVASPAVDVSASAPGPADPPRIHGGAAPLPGPGDHRHHCACRTSPATSGSAAEPAGNAR